MIIIIYGRWAVQYGTTDQWRAMCMLHPCRSCMSTRARDLASVGSDVESDHRMEVGAASTDRRPQHTFYMGSRLHHIKVKCEPVELDTSWFKAMSHEPLFEASHVWSRVWQNRRRSPVDLLCNHCKRCSTSSLSRSKWQKKKESRSVLKSGGSSGRREKKPGEPAVSRCRAVRCSKGERRVRCKHHPPLRWTSALVASNAYTRHRPPTPQKYPHSMPCAIHLSQPHPDSVPHAPHTSSRQR